MANRKSATLRFSFIIALTVGAAACAAEQETSVSEDEVGSTDPYEVWLIDQSNTNGLAYGGTIHIWHRRALRNPATAVESDIIDLGGAAASLCFANTGANPVRPHILTWNSTKTHAIIAFVASGHVLIMNARTRTPVGCVRMTAGFGGAIQAHSAVPSPDDTYLLVTNQNGKKVEKVSTNYRTNTYTRVDGAAIDLAACATPNGVPCELAGVRPDNGPVYTPIASSGRFAFVTLRGGGLFVVNPRTTPMSIVGEYDNTTVHANGGLGSQTGGFMFIDSVGGLATNLHQFDLYRFPLSGYSASNAPNTPAPRVVFSDESPDRDAHGTVVVNEGDYLWVIDRAANLAEVFNVNNNTRVNTVLFSGSSDPAGDLGAMSPDGGKLFISMRGPIPLSGDPHVSTGAVPGLGIIDINDRGADGDMIGLIPIHNVDAAGVERADGHAVGVRGL